MTADIWPFAERDGASALRNAGPLNPDGTEGAAGRIVRAAGGVGSAVLSQDTSGLAGVAGVLELLPQPPRGPVGLFRIRSAPMLLAFAFRTFAAAPTGDYFVVAVGYDPAGAELWSVRVYEDGGEFVAQMWTTAGGGYVMELDRAVADGTWRTLALFQPVPGGPLGVFWQSGMPDARGGGPAGDLASTRWVVLGGAMGPFSPGSQRKCAHVWFAGLASSPQSIGGIEAYLRLGGTDPLADRFSTVVRWAGLAPALLGSDGRQVSRVPTVGRTAADVIDEVARTASATVWHNPATGQVTLIHGGQRYPTAVTATLTLGDDDDADAADLTWSAGAESAPTVVVAQSPAGDARVELAQARARRDETVQTAAASIGGARAVAGWRVLHGRGLRVESLAVDLATTATDQWAAVMALRPGSRVRIAGTPAEVVGRTHADGHVRGWTETWSTAAGRPVARFDLELEAADDPRPFLVGTSRIDLAAGVLGADVTESASSLLLDGEPLTTSAAAYPLVLDVGGELVTVTAAPASSSLPQTLSVTRGVAPSVARPHVAGEVIRMGPVTGLAP